MSTSCPHTEYAKIRNSIFKTTARPLLLLEGSFVLPTCANFLVEDLSSFLAGSVGGNKWVLQFDPVSWKSQHAHCNMSFFVVYHEVNALP